MRLEQVGVVDVAQPGDRKQRDRDPHQRDLAEAILLTHHQVGR